jgi:hypothetical protein
MLLCSDKAIFGMIISIDLHCPLGESDDLFDISWLAGTSPELDESKIYLKPM